MYNNLFIGEINSMKIAILILAHKNINQLLRLAQRLQGKDIDLYIHLDKKWNVSTEMVCISMKIIILN